LFLIKRLEFILIFGINFRWPNYCWSQNCVFNDSLNTT